MSLWPYIELTSTTLWFPGERIYRLGLSINAKDARGQTALHSAVVANRPDIVHLLLSFKVRHGAVTWVSRWCPRLWFFFPVTSVGVRWNLIVAS